MVTSESTGATRSGIEYACYVLYFQSRLSVTYRSMPQQALGLLVGSHRAE